MIYASNTLAGSRPTSSPIDEMQMEVVEVHEDVEMEVVCLEWSGSSSRRMQICCNILASLSCLRSAHQKEAAHSTTLFIPCKQNEHDKHIND